MPFRLQLQHQPPTKLLPSLQTSPDCPVTMETNSIKHDFRYLNSLCVPPYIHFQVQLSLRIVRGHIPGFPRCPKPVCDSVAFTCNIHICPSVFSRLKVTLDIFSFGLPETRSQSLTYKVSWNSLHSSSCPRTLGNPPASASQG